MVNRCYNIQKYQAKLDCGDQFLNEQYSIAVVFLKTANLTTAWQLGTKLFTKLKAGSIIKTIMNKYAVLQICRLLTYLNLKKTPRNILKIHHKKGQHYYLLYWIERSVIIMVQVKYLTMDCSLCQKEFDKLYYLNSDCSHWDYHFYCKKCFRKLFRMLPEKVKLTFYGYKGKDQDVS